MLVIQFKAFSCRSHVSCLFQMGWCQKSSFELAFGSAQVQALERRREWPAPVCEVNPGVVGNGPGAAKTQRAGYSHPPGEGTGCQPERT